MKENLIRCVAKERADGKLSPKPSAPAGHDPSSISCSVVRHLFPYLRKIKLLLMSLETEVTYHYLRNKTLVDAETEEEGRRLHAKGQF